MKITKSILTTSIIAIALTSPVETVLASDGPVFGKNIIAIGPYSEASGDNSINVGGIDTAGKNSVALGYLSKTTAENSVALGVGSVSNRTNTVSIGSSGSERQLTNVKAGTADTDGVNVSQMNDGLANTLASTNNYTNLKYQQGVAYTNQIYDQSISYAQTVADTAEQNAHNYTDWRFSQLSNASNQQFRQLDDKINRAEKRLNAAVAGATAIASIPYLSVNNFSYGVAVGNYQNGNALAGGIQKKLSQNMVVRVSVSWDSSSNTALGVGLAGGN